MNRCLFVGLLAEALLVVVLWFALGNWFGALFVSLSACGILGFCAGFVALKRMVVLKPFRRVAA
jgi:hypothetical protein